MGTRTSKRVNCRAVLRMTASKTFLPPSLPSLPTSLFLHRPLLTMRYRQARMDSVILSNQTAFALCDGLLRMAQCWIIELPETELREIRNVLEGLLVRTDQALDLMEGDISLDFEGLGVDSGGLATYYPSSSDVFQTLVILLGPKTSVPYLFQLPLHRVSMISAGRI